MEYVEPIKDIQKINEIKQVLLTQSKRDYVFFVLGINTGIRINDLLYLKVEDVWDGEKVKEFLYIRDARNEPIHSYYLNNVVNRALEDYLSGRALQQSDFLFKSRKNETPITRQQAYRIINKAAKEVGISEKIGTHTLRKTFGYHAYRKGIAVSLLKTIFNHATPAETLRYIGIDRNEVQLVKVDVNL